MRRILLAATLLLGIGVSAFAQTSSISGTVSDPTNALIPGVTVTATNTGTGVNTTSLTNDSGAYNFVTLPPGPYKLTATLGGFQTASVTNITLGTAETQRFNITMKLGNAQGTTVDVAVDASQILSQSSSSIGEVLSVDRVRDLPLIGGDVLSLINIMPGVNGETFAGISSNAVNTVRDGLSVSDGRFQNGVYATTVINPDLVGEVKIILAPVDAELGRGNGQVIITTRSGTNQYTGSVVYNITNSGLNPNTWAGNQIGNFRQSDGLTPCEVQQASDDCKWTLTNKPNWFTNHHITGSYGGPIIKNKTFFFALWDQQQNFQRTLTSALVMTEPAKQGIFRYWDNWNNGYALQAPPATAVTAAAGGTIASVDLNGNPLAPPFNPDLSTPYTGGLKCISVFGNIKVDGSAFGPADCPGGTAIIGPAWDPLRPAFDSTGYIQRILKEMPVANNWGTAIGNPNQVDGLNTAAYRYVRGREGNTGANVTTGQDLNSNRWQFNLKLDHNFSASEKISGSWSYEKNDTSSDLSTWPDQVSYNIFRYPQVFTVNFTSTLSSSLLNEARFGLRYANEGAAAPWESPISDVKDRALSWFLPGPGEYKTLVNPGAGNYAYGGSTNGVMVTGPGQYNGNKSPLWNYADTLSWTRGRHALKFGGEVRLTRSDGYNNIPQFPWPRVNGGAGGNPSPLGSPITALGTLAGGTPSATVTTGNKVNVSNMSYFLNGSINGASMLYWITSQDDVPTQYGGTSTDPNGHWQDVTTTPPLGRKFRKTIQNEWDVFVKDDFKATKNLTLNLGMRYEYYGSPYLGDGFTVTSVDQGAGLFGPARVTTGNLFSNWLVPGNLYLNGYGSTPSTFLQCSNGVAQPGLLTGITSNCDPALLTTPEFVGPGTNHPDKQVFKNDLNNFGPAVGFSWNLPFFGEGKTTIRGGYQITYGGSGRLVGGGGATSTEVIIGGIPGALSQANTVLSDFTALTTGRALTLADVPALLPVRPTNPAIPGGIINVYGRSAAFSSVAPDHATPYTQNFTLSMQRNVNSRVQVALNYVGTVAKKLEGSLNTNETNVYYNKELWDALEMTREGLDAPLFDQMFAGLDLHGTVGTGYGPVGTIVGGVLQHGSAHLRRNATYSQNLVNGRFDTVSAALNTLSATSSTTSGLLQPLPIDPATGQAYTGVLGRVLRNGCDRLANNIANIGSGGTATTNPLSVTPNRCFPENYITMSPQLGNTTTYVDNTGHSTYHSVQGQVTLRPKQGITYQATYSIVKALALPGSGYADYRNQNLDYTDTNSSHNYEFRSNGSFELPFGPNKLVLGNSTGWVARAIEHWQTNIIYNFTSGNWTNIAASTGMYGAFVPDAVTPWTHLSGDAKWNGPAGNGPGGAGTGTSSTGTYFGQAQLFTKVNDPQCQLSNHVDTMGFNLLSGNSTTNAFANCTLQALADAKTGTILLQNAPTGTPMGNLGQNKIRGNGTWTLDGNLSKTFRITESKSLQVRVDATNVLNHPWPAQPNLSLAGNADFGSINTKGGANNGNPRSFQGQVRFSF